MLAHERIAARDGRAGNGRASLWFLHGIFGSRQNWRGVARRLVDRRPEWSARLVDLRMHGESQHLRPPHDLHACARDLSRLARELAEVPRALIGHSFGAKVALLYASRRPDGLRQLWVVDGSPSSGSPDRGVQALLEHRRVYPGPFRTREAATRALTERGVSEAVARWFAMNLVQECESYRWRLDPDAVESLLLDFHATDLWSVVSAPPGGCEIHFVKATRSVALPEAECRRIEALAQEGVALRLHRVEGGHWLNADAPEELTRLFAGELP